MKLIAFLVRYLSAAAVERERGQFDHVSPFDGSYITLDCLPDCMLAFEQDMIKCEGLEAQEEFRCITSGFKVMAECLGGCIPDIKQ